MNDRVAMILAVCVLASVWLYTVKSRFQPVNEQKQFWGYV